MGVTAVDDLSFEVHRGEVFGVLGPNGVGKTTTIRIVMDIFKPDEESVLVLGGAPRAARDRDGTFVLTLAGNTPQELLKTLLDRDIPIEVFEVASVPLQEIFIAAVKEGRHA